MTHKRLLNRFPTHSMQPYTNALLSVRVGMRGLGSSNWISGALKNFLCGRGDRLLPTQVEHPVQFCVGDCPRKLACLKGLALAFVAVLTTKEWQNVLPICLLSVQKTISSNWYASKQAAVLYSQCVCACNVLYCNTCLFLLQVKALNPLDHENHQTIDAQLLEPVNATGQSPFPSTDQLSPTTSTPSTNGSPISERSLSEEGLSPNPSPKQVALERAPSAKQSMYDPVSLPRGVRLPQRKCCR